MPNRKQESVGTAINIFTAVALFIYIIFNLISSNRKQKPQNVWSQGYTPKNNDDSNRDPVFKRPL